MPCDQSLYENGRLVARCTQEVFTEHDHAATPAEAIAAGTARPVTYRITTADGDVLTEATPMPDGSWRVVDADSVYPDDYIVRAQVEVDPEVFARYATYRREGVRAGQALQMARWTASPTRADLAEWDSRYEDTFTFDSGPYQVTVKVEDDPYGAPDGKFTDTWTPDCVDLARFTGERQRDPMRYRYYERAQGTYAKDRAWLVEHNYGRREADELAREWERREVDQALNYRYLDVTVTVSLATVELAGSSVGGIGYDPRQGIDDDLAEHLRDLAGECVDDALTDAPARLAMMNEKVTTP